MLFLHKHILLALLVTVFSTYYSYTQLINIPFTQYFLIKLCTNQLTDFTLFQPSPWPKPHPDRAFWPMDEELTVFTEEWVGLVGGQVYHALIHSQTVL